MATNNSSNNQLGPNSSLTMSAAGAMNLPQQPSFLVYLASSVTNVTGEGSTYNILFDTEVYDNTSSYSAGVFTTPQTGNYLFTMGVTLLSGTISTSNLLQLNLNTDLLQYNPINLNPNGLASTAGVGQSFSVVAPMVKDDQATVQVIVSGLLLKTVGVAGGTPLVTYWSGTLLN